jgi:hypothetical protein
MRLAVGDAKAYGDNVQERRVGQFCAPTAKIVPGVENKLEPPGARLPGAYQGLVSAAVGVGHDIGDERALGPASYLVKLYPHAFGWLSDCHVKDMGRYAGQIPLPLRFKVPLRRARDDYIDSSEPRLMRYGSMQN